MEVAFEALRIFFSSDSTFTKKMPAIFAFIRVVDWSEMWFSVVLGFHLCMCVLTFASRREQCMQLMQLLLIVTLLHFTPQINHFMETHWVVFAGQPYFDPDGTFITIIFSLPLMIHLCVLLMRFCPSRQPLPPWRNIHSFRDQRYTRFMSG
jgi:hypothetical protein